MSDTLFASMYDTDRDRAGFGEFWCGPDRVKAWGWTTVAKVPKAYPDGDGQDCEIDMMAAPARFYRVRALPTPNSMDDIAPAWCMSTGSGSAMAVLCLEIAKAASEGMISPDTDEEES